MDNSRATIETLKKALKQRGFTYADVARELDLSEASVKKMFASYHFTLNRLDKVCEMLGIDFIDLVRLFDRDRHQISTLTLAQEQELVRDGKLFIVAICARNHWKFEEILESFDISKAELLRYLGRLEQLKLLELHPNNRIKLCVAEDFRWLRHGPIEQLFTQHLYHQFMDSDFDGLNDLRLYLHGPITAGAKELINRRLNALAHEFSELLKESVVRPISERDNVGLLIAMREWEPAFVTQHRK